MRLFSENGYTGTGVSELGEAAGLARGALYYYIGSKEALLAEIHDRVMDPLLAEAKLIAAMDIGSRARLRLLSESLLWQILHRPDNVWVFLHEYRHLEGEHRAQFREKRRAFETYVGTALEEGRQSGEVVTSDPDLTTLAFFNLHNYTYQWQAGHPGLEVEKLASFYCAILLRGIGAVEQPDDPELRDELTKGRSVLAALRSA
ncbi:TetR/AcrR family transcriptional regulator [Aeromicrobium sp.]|uniref:TetR/AcrR family transcriptional regulator n=1 Tax=Aeromicrobium sp. TaxID=1871063 RepID=UPI0025C3B8FA|nr:TetR/AcrR family transcriptional regulator [Aeromicrobium sp.]MCK5890299.1 TetR family transcriptional regulator [Aeromicrobium sp.]